MKKKFIISICLSYSIIMFYVDFSGLLSHLMSPKMHLYFRISAIALFMFSLISLHKKINFGKKISALDTLLLLPIFFIFFLGNAQMSDALVKNKGIKLGAESSVKTSNTASDETPVDTADAEIPENDLPPIILTNENYVETVYEISSSFEKNIGRKITIEGFLYKDSMFNPNHIAVGKFYMSCCAADSQVLGFLTHFDNPDEYKENDWYKIEGYFVKDVSTQYKNEVLVIKPISIKSIPKHDTLYVYDPYQY